MPLKDITQPFPSPGMIRRAKLMNIIPIEDGWEVQQPFHYAHNVVKEAKFYTCDCVGFQMRGMCSHVTAVMTSRAEKARKDLFGDCNDTR